MPVYVYKNLRTGETFEVVQRMTESAWTAHPESGDPVKRLIQPVGIAFRGSGFYVNDSRGSSGKTTASAGGEGASEGSAEGKAAKGAKDKEGTPTADGGSSRDAGSSSASSSGTSSSSSSGTATGSGSGTG